MSTGFRMSCGCWFTFITGLFLLAGAFRRFYSAFYIFLRLIRLILLVNPINHRQAVESRVRLHLGL